jgi:hypothetical protein
MAMPPRDTKARRHRVGLRVASYYLRMLNGGVPMVARLKVRAGPAS